MISNPYVQEVIRIIKKKNPHHTRHSIILVSLRFFREAKQAIKNLYDAQEPALQEFLDVFDENHDKENPITYICHTPIFPVSWLGDYEFEIRKP